MHDQPGGGLVHRVSARLGPTFGVILIGRKPDHAVGNPIPPGASESPIPRGKDSGLRCCPNRDCPNVSRPTTVSQCPVCGSKTIELPWGSA